MHNPSCPFCNTPLFTHPPNPCLTQWVDTVVTPYLPNLSGPHRAWATSQTDALLLLDVIWRKNPGAALTQSSVILLGSALSPPERWIHQFPEPSLPLALCKATLFLYADS